MEEKKNETAVMFTETEVVKKEINVLTELHVYNVDFELKGQKYFYQVAALTPEEAREIVLTYDEELMQSENDVTVEDTSNKVLAWSQSMKKCLDAYKKSKSAKKNGKEG